MYHAWTAEEDEFLKDNYKKTDTELLINILGRDKRDVYNRASKIGLYKISERNMNHKNPRNAHAHALAYMLHIGHINGKTDEEIIGKCINIVRDGALDELILQRQQQYKNVI